MKPGMAGGAPSKQNVGIGDGRREGRGGRLTLVSFHISLRCDPHYGRH